MTGTRFFSALSLLFTVTSTAASAHESHLKPRASLDPPAIYDSYDFILVGGGLSGLVISNRLTEDPSVSVLVLEAGNNGDDVRDRINHPGLAYYNGILDSVHSWGWQTVIQPNVANRTLDWPGGKVIGGSSAANGLYYVRPSSLEVDVWNSLIQGMDGADKWTSDAFFESMRKSETFTPPRDDIRTLGNIQYQESSHGTTGPIHTSYPGFLPDVVGRWITTLGNVGINASPDPANGDNSGAFVTTSTINPTNWTRSYARSGYLDPFDRPNLHILTNCQVTKINFEGTKAVSVEFGQDKETVKVDKEVIVTAGPMGSPSVLMHSGVGPGDVLGAVGIPIVVDLPGVGQHLQDHFAAELVYNTTAETASMIYNNASDPRSHTDEFLSYVNSAIAYVTTSQVMGDDVAWQKEVDAEIDAAVDMVPSGDAGVADGYRALYQAYADKLLVSNAGQVELLLSTTGSSFGPATIVVQAALQRPFSHGRLYLNSSNPFDKPVIDPGYLSHSADLEMLREGLKLARSIAATEPLKSVLTGEVSPGSNITTDADLNNFILTTGHTEYHPSCTSAMLPRELGGVVDAQLKVYGLDNVRVADSSIFPIEFAAHMMAPTYGMAEQAAVILKEQYPLGSGNNVTVTHPRGSAATLQSTTTSVWGIGLVAIAMSLHSLLF